MRSLSSAFLICLLSSTVAAQDSFPVRAGYAEGEEMRVHRQIAPGIVHTFEAKKDGPLTYNVLTVNMADPDLQIETEKAKDNLYGQETLPVMVERLADPNSRPLAAVNADFWGTRAVPINLFVDEGTIWRSAHRGKEGQRRPILAFDDKKNFYLGPPDLTMEVSLTDQRESLTIDCVNICDAETTTILYTWPFGQDAPPVPDDREQVVLNISAGEWLPNAPVKASVLSTDMRTGVTLDRNTIVLHVKKPLPEWIADSEEVLLNAQFPGLEGKVVGIVGGAPSLIRNGVIDPLLYGEEEGMGERFVRDLHPRTAVGLLPDRKTLVFVVVDGRQPRKSIGADLISLAEYMKGLGVVDAINLDGGGSSSMVVEGELVNFPSDAGGPRAVSSALVIRRNAPLGPVAQLELMPAEALVPVGGGIALDITARDLAGEVVPYEHQFGFFAVSMEGRPVEIREGGYATAKHPATATIAAQGGPDVTSSHSTLRFEPVARAEFSPKAVLLGVGETVEVRLGAWNTAGEKFHPASRLNELQVPDFVEFDADTGKVRAIGKGRGVLRAPLGDVTAELSIAVDDFRQQLVQSFDTSPADDPTSWAELTNASKEGTSVTLDTQRKHEGAGSWKFTYAMAKGGTTKIALPIAQTIPGEPLALGLWVYGDGNGHWLRGEVQDAKGGRYYADFTSSKAGIDWKDEWKFVRASMINPPIIRANAPIPTPPLTLKNIYIVQPQEAAKKDGTIWIDELVGLN